MSHCPLSQAFVVVAKSKVEAAVACVRKYFNVASTARGWWYWAMSGRMARVLISSPIHARNQWELANVIVVPKPRVNNKVAARSGFINKGRGLTIILGVWAQKLN